MEAQAPTAFEHLAAADALSAQALSLRQQVKDAPASQERDHLNHIADQLERAAQRHRDEAELLAEDAA